MNADVEKMIHRCRNAAYVLQTQIYVTSTDEEINEESEEIKLSEEIISSLDKLEKLLRAK